MGNAGGCDISSVVSVVDGLGRQVGVKNSFVLKENKVKENLNFLKSSTKLMKAIMDETKLIVSRRQRKNLKQHLTKARFSSTPSKATTVTKCNEPRCRTCNLIITEIQVDGSSITEIQ